MLKTQCSSGAVKILLNLAFVVSIFFTSNNLRASLLDVPLPSGAVVAWVSPQLNQNGLSMAIQSFTSHEDVESTLEFYRSSWASEGELPGFIETSFDAWSVISRLQDGLHTVLQIQAKNGGVSGFLSQTHYRKKLNKATPLARPVFDVPDGMELVSSTHSSEFSKSSSTSVYMSTAATQTLASELERSMESNGWEMQTVHGSNTMHTSMFSKKNRYIELAITDGGEGKTYIFTNEVQLHE